MDLCIFLLQDSKVKILRGDILIVFNILSLLSVIINASVLATLDIHMTNWEYWVSLLCISVSYACGTMRK